MAYEFAQQSLLQNIRNIFSLSGQFYLLRSPNQLKDVLFVTCAMIR